MDINLADLVAAVGEALPDRCALVCDGDRLSYAELTARSEQVAQHLIEAGIGPDVGAEELREYCRAMLAGYKVPARVAFVPEVVRSLTGKADYWWASEVLVG